MGPEWVRDAVFYAILVDRFARSPRDAPAGYDPAAFDPWGAPPRHGAYQGGTLWGVADRLDALADLGVSALLLTPIFPSTTHHRYKPLAFDRVEPLVGGDAALDALLAAAAARGVRVVLDGVFDHVGAGFPPFQDVIAYGESSPWKAWFRIDRFPVEPFESGRPPGYACWAGNRSMPLLDHANPAVRRFVCEVVAAWLRRGVAGFRLDAAHEVEDHGLWRELRAAAEAARPDAYLVGEAWGDASRWITAGAWHGATGYPLLGALRRFVAGPDLAREALHEGSRGEAPLDAPGFARELAALLATPAERDGLPLHFLGTPDTARFRTVAGGSAARARLGAALLLLLPGTPCLLYGDELGLEGGLPPASRLAYPEGGRGDAATLATYRTLARLRRESAALRRGGLALPHAAGSLLVLERALGGERVLAAVNAGAAPARATLPADAAAPALAGARVLGAAVARPVQGAVELAVPPLDATVWRLGA